MKNIHNHTNRIAAYVASMHGDNGRRALMLMRTNKANRDAHVQAFRDIVADEMMHWRRVAKKIAA